MSYDVPGCAYCPPKVRACRAGESEERGPGFCPTKVDPEAIDAAWAEHADPFTMKVAHVAAQVESEGYCQWTRVEEIVQFAHKMGFKRIGIATCIGFLDLAHVLSAVLESHGFEVASAACKNGGVPKESIGITEEEKVRPGGHESICNPISQAKLLNDAGCELNVVLGLCVGHDSMFYRHAEGLVTALAVKDRVLAHNPVGALNLADSYFSRIWGPYKKDSLPKLPAHGNGKTEEQAV